jgi:chromosome segregation ATPase
MDNTVDLEQLQKRVEWLDNERRNDKTIIAALQSKVETSETEKTKLMTRLTEIESEVIHLNAMMARLGQFEGEITTIRTETTRQVESFKDSVQEKHIQTERNSQKLNDINEALTGLRKRILTIEEVDIDKILEERKEEDIRLARLIEELKSKVNDISHFDEDYKRSLRMLEENHRQDAKRLTDIQGEIASIRKRSDETRGKQDLVSENMRKVEVRIKELLDAESERREAQTAFIEKISMSQVTRERTFTEWSERFEKMEKITANLEENLSGLEDTHRSVKQSQAALDEVTQRFERRINEITEVQRLSEDRFRQEWTTFKSDDQKRWSNYIISQDEQHREMNKTLETLTNRIANLEDQIETLQDILQQVGREDINRMQNLLASFRDSIDKYNNLFKD